jgi:hypothetical protein
MREKPAIRFFVVESGATMPAGSVPCVSDTSELSIFVLADADPPNRLALRVLRHIAAIERSGQRIVSATIVTGVQRGAQSLAARCLIARALVAHQAGAGSGELVFSAGTDDAPREQEELLAMAGALTGERGADRVSIRVVIDDSVDPDSAPEWRPLRSTRASTPLSCCPAACRAGTALN